MSDTKKMLKAILNGQHALKAELVAKIDSVENNLRKEIQRVEKKHDQEFAHVHHRLDTIGLQVAYLEDDAPTRDEFDNHQKRIQKLELRQPRSS